MKKISFLIFLFCAFGSHTFGQADSVFYYLSQVKGLASTDSIALENAAYCMMKMDPNEINIPQLESAIAALKPLIKRENVFRLKLGLVSNLEYYKLDSQTIDVSKRLIESLKNNPNTSEKNIVLSVIALSRFPFRNSSRIYEGMAYYQELANYYTDINDSNAISMCYYVLAGIYRAFGINDKMIYYQKKSAVYLNPYEPEDSTYFLFPNFNNIGFAGFLNRKMVLAGMQIEFGEYEEANRLLHETKAIMDTMRNPDDISDYPYLFLQLSRVNIFLNSDSATYYLDILKTKLDRRFEPMMYSLYCMEKAHLAIEKNQNDSAEKFLSICDSTVKKFNLIPNTYAGFLIPNYYRAQIRIRQHRYDDAVKLLKEESDKCLKVNLRRLVLKHYLLMAEAYKLSGNYKMESEALSEYRTIYEALVNEENKGRATSYEIEEQIRNLNAQKQAQQEELVRQHRIRNGIVAGLVVSLLFLFVILRQRNRIAREMKRSEELLLNILPAEVAEELKMNGEIKAKDFTEVTVLFTDFKNFTQISATLTPQELVSEINFCYCEFDKIISKHGIEKIKTIGDSYMCAGGLPVPNQSNAVDMIYAAIEIRDFMKSHNETRKNLKKESFEIRIGIHTGPVVAGIVGLKKYAYDIWGDAVNTASRMESNGVAGKINVSGSTYERIKDQFTCEYRGKIEVKGKGETDMYFVEKQPV